MENHSEQIKNESQNQKKRRYTLPIIILLGTVFCVASLILIPRYISSLIENSIDTAARPVSEAGKQLKTQVNEIIHPTPTIWVDPITVIHEIQNLTRLETIQYSVEKVITAESGDDEFGFLFKDQLLFVAHGMVIAGVDLQKPIDVHIENDVVFIHLPEPEIFITTLDNDKSYVYDRQMGILTRGDPNLETSARRAAEDAILQAALDDGILDLAKENAQSTLSTLLNGLGYSQVRFVDQIKSE